MGLAEQNTLRESIWGSGGGEGGRKIFFVLQTTADDPCVVSPEMRWEMRKQKTKNMLTKVNKNRRFLRVCSLKSLSISMCDS